MEKLDLKQSESNTVGVKGFQLIESNRLERPSVQQFNPVNRKFAPQWIVSKTNFSH